jgi:hypothetical protein
MSWDAQQPLEPPQPEQPQPTEPFSPQAGWTSPAPQNQQNPYEQAPPPYGQQPPSPYGPPQPQQQPPAPPYGQPPQPYEQTLQYGQYPAQQPAYDQYGQPLPPQQGAPWGQFGAQPPYYGAPPPKRRTGLYVGLGVGAVVVAAGVAVAVALSSSNSPTTPVAQGSSTASAAAAPSSPSDTAAASASATGGGSQAARTISVPQTVGSLHLLVDSDTTSRISELKSKLAGNAAYSNPQIGFYTIGSSSAYSVWLLAEDTTDIPTFKDSVSALGADGAAKEIANAANMNDIQTQSPGPLGGAMLCGTLTEDTVDVFACEWVDDSSFGWVYFMPSVSHTKAIAYTLDLRGAAEK